MLMRYRPGALLCALLLGLAPGCGGGAPDQPARASEEADQAPLPEGMPAGALEDTAAGAQAQARPEANPQVASGPTSRPQARTTAPASVSNPQETAREAAPASREARTETATAAVGTTFAATLNETLSTETNRVGDLFTATLPDAIRDADGVAAIPAGALIRGRLTQVEKSGRVGETGVIALAFESISFDGQSLPLEGTVVKANPERKSRSSTGAQVGKAAAGAAAGAVLGRVIGKDTRSTIVGAVVGAAAGTAIAMGTADVDVVLPAGSDLVIRLDAPIEVRRPVR